jgi:multidrug efflux system membrane fusion protein
MDHRWSGLLLLLVVPMGGCQGSSAAMPKTALPNVEYHMPVSGHVTDYSEFPGQTDARVTVQVTARVSGYMTKVYFTDGTFAYENQVLFQIDPRPYKAERERAEGNVQQMEAHLRRQEREYHRAEKLLAKGSVSQEEFERYEADYRETKGNLEITKANRELAKLNLEWTEVKAPSAGLLSRRMVDPGNLIKADDTILTSIVTQDPMYVYFDVDEQNTLKVRRLIREGTIKAKSEKEVPVMVGLSDEAPSFPHIGTVDFTDNKVDVATGSLRFRATVRNEKGILTPGLFVRVRLPIGDPHSTLFVREEALASDQGRKIVYVISDEAEGKPAQAEKNGDGHKPRGAGAEPKSPEHHATPVASATKPAGPAGKVKGTIETKEVKIGALRNGFRAIETGLAPGDKVVITGLQRIRPGVVVNATEKKIKQAVPKDISFLEQSPTENPVGALPDRITRNVSP